ncbi:MAG: purine-nucleoside phosphorylase [Anaerolineales bacterium]|nr:purine-nucleoside phosphorylase [Anaerolineales bacterium]MCS7247434.1 purine-nucleoside phosphorylase [Anaerolineales bacterium]MDW8161245.1 purine-nucleoside phosphorylase [Anaerolineales bacterium]MDW8445989.1 purine-nucleoside phosphorylase [Anaerolineales bacterium]
MSEWIGLDQIDETAEFLCSRLPFRPFVGLILGSGLGEIAESVLEPTTVPFREIPNWPRSTVEGHKGQLVLGELEGQRVLVSQGRVHYYEGYSMAQVAFPVRVMQRLGVRVLIVTNAAGAVNPEFEPGDLMLITDHINLVGMAGLTPLRGANLDELGPRFPDMSQAYDRELCEFARQAALEHGIRLREGVYICLAGPSFETPADLRFLRLIGADAVGMSTVPEVTAARHGGMRVLGLSGISNKANLDGSTVTTHEEVLRAGQMIVPQMSRILRGVLRRLAFP